jgi:hypothetical protein
VTRERNSSLILTCLAATWIVWGSTYLAIKFALLSLPPFFQMGTRFLALRYRESETALARAAGLD